MEKRELNACWTRNPAPQILMRVPKLLQAITTRHLQRILTGPCTQYGNDYDWIQDVDVDFLEIDDSDAEVLAHGRPNANFQVPELSQRIRCGRDVKCQRNY